MRIKYDGIVRLFEEGTVLISVAEVGLKLDPRCEIVKLLVVY
jgi:hypothetical protein